MSAVTPVPTRPGDVLILQTGQSYAVHVVGLVTSEGQQDFHDSDSVRYETEAARATAHAQALASPGRKIFCLNMDTGKWTVMPSG
jgi:hypothetical protein